jgi:hypothetical protein
MVDASHCLSLAEAGTKKQIKNSKSSKSSHRFQSGIEWEILQADAVVLLGLTHALRYAPFNKSWFSYLPISVYQRIVLGIYAMHVIITISLSHIHNFTLSQVCFE